jgi:hypothetical protein
MEQDQRLTPLPKSVDLKVVGEYSPGYPSLYDEASDEGRRSIQQYFNIVYKRLPIILALTLIVTAAVAFYMYRLPSKYVGTTEMLI